VETTSDREWILSVVRQYEGPLTIYAARRLGDVDRARDIVQDAFLKLWQADRPTVEDHVAKWLYTVCRNRVLDVRRKEHRMTTLEDRQIEAASAPPASPDGTTETENAGSRDPAGPAGKVVEAVAVLPERQQEAVRLKFQGGLSYREIAEVMDTTVNNVGVLLHTAIKSLRGQLAGAPVIAGPSAGPIAGQTGASTGAGR